MLLFKRFFKQGIQTLKKIIIEKPQQLTENINHGVVVFDKKYSDKVFEENIALFFNDSMAEMETHLSKMNELKTDFLSEKLKEEYAALKGRIIKGIEEEIEEGEEEGKNKMEEGPHQTSKKEIVGASSSMEGPHQISKEKIVATIFESNSNLFIISKTSLALVEFIDEFKNERNKLAKEFCELKGWSLKKKIEKVLKKYDDFYDKLQKRWAKAVFDYSYHKELERRGLTGVDIERAVGQVVIEEGIKEKTKSGKKHNAKKNGQEPQILKFNPHSINTNTFWLAIYGIENPVNQISGKKDSAIIAAIGDANTSANPKTVSGMSTGKFLI